MSCLFRNGTTIVILSLLALSFMSFSDTTASIKGVVFGGKAIPSEAATVRVVDKRTGVEKTFQTNGSGIFLATGLAVGGPYEVSVAGQNTITIKSLDLGETTNVVFRADSQIEVNEVIVTAEAGDNTRLAAMGSSSLFDESDLNNLVAFEREVFQLYETDPRLYVDGYGSRGSVNCAGKHPRYNTFTADGVNYSDRFGLNSNGFATADGMPVPYDAIEQVAVEFSPLDAKLGGFSACYMNLVTKSGTNEWEGSVFYEFTSDDLQGDRVGDVSYDPTPYDSTQMGFTFGGPIITDKLFVFAAYEEKELPRGTAAGYNGQGSGDDKSWLSQADWQRIQDIASNVYSYDAGGSPTNTVAPNEKYSLKIDYTINDQHSAHFLYGFSEGNEQRLSDSDPNEFEYANHMYTKGAKLTAKTLKLNSQWTDSFSSEFFINNTEMIDSQNTNGPLDFGDHQINVGNPFGSGGVVYIGADDSRQANELSWYSTLIKLKGSLVLDKHIIEGGYEKDTLEVFNMFVPHSAGGEHDYRDYSDGNPASCANLSAIQRLETQNDSDITNDCGLTGIDGFELGKPYAIYYGSGSGTNNPRDGAASFDLDMNALYVQDTYFFDSMGLEVTAGLRYEWFETDDTPNFNENLLAQAGVRNDVSIDGLDILMPRIGVEYDFGEDIKLRGGLGVFSGGNPLVWLSNTYSDGVIRVFSSRFRESGQPTVFDMVLGINGNGRPGYDAPQSLYQNVANTTPADADTYQVAVLDSAFEQPSELRYTVGGTWFIDDSMRLEVDLIHSTLRDAVITIDPGQETLSSTLAGAPIYTDKPGNPCCGTHLLTNSDHDAKSTMFSVLLNKEFDFGLTANIGYASVSAEDLSGMEAAQASTNYQKTALIDANNPSVGDSMYAVPHRFTFNLNYKTQLISGYDTMVQLSGFRSAGQPTSAVMSSEGLEPNIEEQRHLLYVPTLNDAAVDLSRMSSSDLASFDSFIADQGLARGTFVGRNELSSRWRTRLDLYILQEIPAFFEGAKGHVYLKMYNLGNFLSDDNGFQGDAAPDQMIVASDVNADGQHVYTAFNAPEVTNQNVQYSVWNAKVGIKFSF